MLVNRHHVMSLNLRVKGADWRCKAAQFSQQVNWMLLHSDFDLEKAFQLEAKNEEREKNW